MLGDDPTNSVLSQVGIPPQFESYVIEGAGFALGGVLLSLAILWFGGAKLKKRLQ